jgi:hypothetical protein
MSTECYIKRGNPWCIDVTVCNIAYEEYNHLNTNMRNAVSGMDELFQEPSAWTVLILM